MLTIFSLWKRQNLKAEFCLGDFYIFYSVVFPFIYEVQKAGFENSLPLGLGTNNHFAEWTWKEKKKKENQFFFLIFCKCCCLWFMYSVSQIWRKTRMN